MCSTRGRRFAIATTSRAHIEAIQAIVRWRDRPNLAWRKGFLSGIFDDGWGWAVAGAFAIVLAAMYMLRLISGVLHQDVGPAVPEEALDLRPAELAVIVPLVGCLLALSAWPAAITEHLSF